MRSEKRRGLSTMKNMVVGALIIGVAVLGYLYYQSRQNTVEITLPDVTIKKN
jgi:predicted negative regulator of RcsB-dependent stress response